MNRPIHHESRNRTVKIVLFIMYCTDSLLVGCHRVVNKGRRLCLLLRPRLSRFLLFASIAPCCSHPSHQLAVRVHRTNLLLAFFEPTFNKNCSLHFSTYWLFQNLKFSSA